jgi:hypothetical protein
MGVHRSPASMHASCIHSDADIAQKYISIKIQAVEGKKGRTLAEEKQHTRITTTDRVEEDVEEY